MKARLKLSSRDWICLLVLIAASALCVAEPATTPIALIPVPREIRQLGVLTFDHSVAVQADSNPEDRFAARQLAEALDAVGVKNAKTAESSIFLLRLETPKAKDVLTQLHLNFSDAMHDEGYVLISEGPNCYIIGETGAGIFYGVQTFRQLIQRENHVAKIPRVIVRDWPAMKYRAQDDDLSRGPFPTLEFQKKQIRTFASYKLNIYSPYFENTLQFTSNPLPAPPGGSLSREEVEELVQYARQYHITVVPEQEAFGHLHHVLLHERYAHLAETPHGAVLAPGQAGSLQLISEWFREIAQMFPGPFIHVGADETDDLGWGQTKQAVAEQGLGKVYIDFVKQIHETLLPLNKRLLFWGDVAMNSPDLVKTMPNDMIAVAWQYSMPEEGRFDRWITPFTNAGIETWVAPSAQRGNRIYPDNDNDLKTIQAFVRDGQRLGATGMFNTVWVDGGEGIFDQNWYGVLFGAAASWQAGESSLDQFEQSYGPVFHGDASGNVNQAQIELMQAHLTLAKVGLYAKNVLFWEDPWSKAGQQDSSKILPVARELRLHAENAVILLEKTKKQRGIQNADALEAMELAARKFDFIGQKFQQADEMLKEYETMYAEQTDKSKHQEVSDLSYFITGNNGQCQDMRDGYGLIRDLFSAAWLKDNRPYWLDNVTAQYELNMELWIKRGIAFREVANEFDKTGRLPSPQEMGLPEQAARN
jgi:hypothetical protein